MSDDVMKTDEKIRTACPNCGQRMRIKSKYLGKTIPCPTCKAPFLVKILDEPGDSTGENAAVDSAAAPASGEVGRELAAAKAQTPPPTRSEADALMKVLHDSETASRGETPASGGGHAHAADAADGSGHDDEFGGMGAEDAATGGDHAESGDNAGLDDLGGADESAADERSDERADEPSESEASASDRDESAPAPAEDESAPDEAASAPAANERRTSPPVMSRPPAYKKPARDAAPAARSTTPSQSDSGSSAALASAPAPRRPARKMTSRIEPSHHFKAYISTDEAAVAEYDFGTAGVLVPERTRVLVTDQSVLVIRKRSYLFGLLPGSDSWYHQVPIGSKDLSQARVFVPSIGRAFGVFLLALALGGAFFAVMWLHNSTTPGDAERVAFLGHFDLFSWMLRLPFNINDMDTYWWTAAPAVLVWLYYWWTFKAWFETAAFKVPIGRSRTRQQQVRACLQTIGMVRSGSIEENT